MVHDLGLAVVAVVEQQLLRAAALHTVGQEQHEGEDEGQGGHQHRADAAALFPHPALGPAHQQVDDDGDDHQRAGAAENGREILRADAAVDHAAEAAAAHKGREDCRADGVDYGDTDAGEDRGEGEGELHHDEAVDPAHAHAAGGLLDAGVHLLEAEAGISDDGQQGIEGDAHNDCDLTGPKEDHQNAQQGQGGDGLQQVDDAENDAPGLGIEVSQYAEGQTDEHREDAGRENNEQVFPNKAPGHFRTSFRIPRGVTFFCRRSIRAPMTMASRAAGIAPSRINVLLLEEVPW